VHFAMSGARNGSVTLHRAENSIGDYTVDYRLSALEEVAALTKRMPDAFIAASGADITDAFHQYLRPLLGAGLPEVGRLRNLAVSDIRD
jgi:ATP-dependent phosphofructokinase / diphosphate-dependent phosphofructokinase